MEMEGKCALVHVFVSLLTIDHRQQQHHLCVAPLALQTSPPLPCMWSRPTRRTTVPTATLGRRRVDDLRSAPEAPQPCWNASKREFLLILRDVLMHSGQHGAGQRVRLGSAPVLVAPVRVV